MCTFLFWMEHSGIWNWCILGFVNKVNSELSESWPPSVTRPVIIVSCCVGPSSHHSTCVALTLRESIPRLFNGGRTTMTNRCARACRYWSMSEVTWPPKSGVSEVGVFRALQPNGNHLPLHLPSHSVTPHEHDLVPGWYVHVGSEALWPDRPYTFLPLSCSGDMKNVSCTVIMQDSFASAETCLSCCWIQIQAFSLPGTSESQQKHSIHSS